MLCASLGYTGYLLVAVASFVLCERPQLVRAAVLQPLSPPGRGAGVRGPFGEQPYRIAALLSFAHDARLTPRLRQDVLRRFRSHCTAFVGDAWQIELQDVSGKLAASSSESLEGLSSDRVGAFCSGRDKLFLLGVRFAGDRFLLAAREYDVPLRRWSPVFQTVVREPGQVARELVVLASRMFSPVARLESRDLRRVRIRIKGGRLPTLGFRSTNAQAKQKASFQFIQTGALLRPMRRVVDEDGNTVDVVPIPWTFYRLERRRGPTAWCRVISALRNPLPPRTEDPNEPQLILARTAGGPTQLRLVSRWDGTPLPAIDIEVREQPESASIPIGTTDFNGGISIPPSRQGPALVTVFVRLGGSTLARLPILPGAGAEPDLRLRLDPVRLEIEGCVQAVQVRIIDHVAERKILETRTRSAIKRKNWETAERMLGQLEQTPTLEQMQAELDAARKLADQLRGQGVPQTLKVERMFSETQRIIQTFFNPDELSDLLEELRDELENERDAAAAAAAAQRSSAPFSLSQGM